MRGSSLTKEMDRPFERLVPRVAARWHETQGG